MGIHGLLNVYDTITKKTIRDFGTYIQWDKLSGKTLIVDVLAIITTHLETKPIRYDTNTFLFYTHILIFKFWKRIFIQFI